MATKRGIGRQVNYIVKWLVLAPLLGMVAALAVEAFIWTRTVSVRWMIGTVGFGWMCLLVPAGGLLMYLVFLRLDRKLSGEGMDRYIITVNRRGGYLPLKLGLGKFLATLCVLIACPVGGTVGPMAMVMSGISGSIQQFMRKHLRIFRYRKEDLMTAVVCGCAGVVSATFGTPVGGGIFAAEVLAPDRIRYRHLFPAILSGVGAWLMFSGILGLEYHWPELLWWGSATWQVSLLCCVPVAVLVGLLSLVFVRGYSATFRAFRSAEKITRWWPVLAACVIALVLLATFAANPSVVERLFYVGNPQLSSTRALVSGVESPLSASDVRAGWVGVAAVLVLEMVVLTLLVASGNSAGLTGPTVAMGAIAGYLIFMFLGGVVPPRPMVACAVAAMMAGVLNVPLAAIVIVIEVMGQGCAVPAIIGSLISFQIARSNVVFRYMDIDRRTGG